MEELFGPLTFDDIARVREIPEKSESGVELSDWAESLTDVGVDATKLIDDWLRPEGNVHHERESIWVRRQMSKLLKLYSHLVIESSNDDNSSLESGKPRIMKDFLSGAQVLSVAPVHLASVSLLSGTQPCDLIKVITAVGNYCQMTVFPDLKLSTYDIKEALICFDRALLVRFLLLFLDHCRIEHRGYLQGGSWSSLQFDAKSNQYLLRLIGVNAETTSGKKLRYIARSLLFAGDYNSPTIELRFDAEGSK